MRYTGFLKSRLPTPQFLSLVKPVPGAPPQAAMANLADIPRQPREDGSVAPAPDENQTMCQNRQKSRDPLFAKRWFSDDVILASVSWYLRFKLSYRDLAQIMAQMGVTGSVANSRC
jgi:hypothetical protein